MRNFNPTAPNWTSEEDAILHSFYGKVSPDELLSMLDRSYSSIKNRAIKLGIKVNLKWTPEEDEILKSSYSTKSVNEIAILLNRKPGSIANRAHFLNLKRTNRYWTPEDDEILKSMYKSHESLQFISDRLKRTIPSVSNRGATLGVIKRPSYNHVFNRNYFDKVTEESAYWAGFIAADGNIFKHVLRIQLSINDVDHLDKFRKCIGYDFPVSVRNVPFHTMVDGKFVDTGKFHDVCVLQLYSEEIVTSLKEIYNITPKKSLTLMPPNLECTKYKLAYIVGLIDGDGTVYSNKLSYKFRFYDQLHIRLLGTFSVLEWIKFVIESLLSCGSLIYKYDYSSCYSYGIYGKNALKFFNFISMLDIPKLDRKWLIAKKFLPK